MYSYQDKNHLECLPNVEAVLTKPEGSYLLKQWHFGNNIVTNNGEVYYAQKTVGETPTTDFGANGRFALRTGSELTPAATDTFTEFDNPSTNAIDDSYATADDATYPKRNDDDGDNTGAGTNVVTWRKSWGTGDFTGNTISGVAIIATASPTTGTPILNNAVFSPTFNKTGTDTLKVFVNHLFGA